MAGVQLASRGGDVGTGLYTFPEAARILQRGFDLVTTRQLRYWMSTGLTPSSFRADDITVLSFDDLISLEVVKRFRADHVSLQRIRKFEEELSEFTGFERPFGYRSFFTDGAKVWGQRFCEEGPIAIELSGRNLGHAVWLDAIRTFATEITYSGQDQRAAIWNLNTHVQINPSVQFGAPVVRGTRVTVDTVAANLKVAPPAEVADWYGLTLDEVRGVQEYLAAS